MANSEVRYRLIEMEDSNVDIEIKRYYYYNYKTIRSLRKSFKS